MLHKNVSKYPLIDCHACDGTTTVPVALLAPHCAHDRDNDLAARSRHTTMFAR